MTTTTSEAASNVRQGPGVYASLAILAELLFLLLRMMSTYITAFIRAVSPVTEKSVSGEIVLITGTGHGIGKELARIYGELGAVVVCVDVNSANNSETVAELTKAGVSAHAYTCDVADREKVLQLRDQVQAEVGTVTILVNNAGIMPCKPLAQQTEQIIKKQFDINVFAHFWMLEAFLPKMLEKDHGHIVALSSVAGITGNPNLVPYCATKFAVRGLMEALAEEHRKNGSNVKFTTIYPYMTDTGLCKNPRLRFPEFFNMLTPKETASGIVSAQRRNFREATVPTYMLHLNNAIRNMPRAASEMFIDFVDSGLEPHD